jgi:tetratricopeptide (TPR) repeat protein
MTRVGIFASILLGLSGGGTSAAVSVMGAGFAKSCFEAAESSRPLREAMRICESALLDDRLDAGDRAATLVNRGVVQMQARNYHSAIADYDAAIKIRPESAEAYVNKGIALMRMGNRDEDAVAQLSEGIARNPQRPEIAFYSRAVAHEGLGHARQAYEDYSRAAQLAPEWAEPAEQLQRFQIVRRKTALG